VPKERNQVELKMDDEEMNSTRFWGMSAETVGITRDSMSSQFSEGELYEALKNIGPTGAILGDVNITSGRPNWASIFDRIQAKHAGKSVGVAFCGSPAIGADLQSQCTAHSDVSTNTLFRLHKENF